MALGNLLLNIHLINQQHQITTYLIITHMGLMSGISDIIVTIIIIIIVIVMIRTSIIVGVAKARRPFRPQTSKLLSFKQIHKHTAQQTTQRT